MRRPSRRESSTVHDTRSPPPQASFRIASIVTPFGLAQTVCPHLALTTDGVDVFAGPSLPDLALDRGIDYCTVQLTSRIQEKTSELRDRGCRPRGCGSD